MPPPRFTPLRAARLVAFTVCWAVAGAAAAPPPAACPLDRPVPTAPPPAPSRPAEPGPTTLHADRARALDADVIELEGNAEAVRDGERLTADNIRHDRAANTIDASGNVTVTRPEGARFTTEALHLDLDTGTGEAGPGTYALTGARLGRGDTARIEFLGRERTRLHDLRYTTCPEGRDDWFLRAGRLDLDTTEDIGVARNVTLELFGLPVFYFPYLSFPISDERKSGFLFPEIGHGSRLGAVVATPYYWNIAPNYDVTLTPRLMTDRGVQLQTEFRYLGRAFAGELDAEYLPNDDLTGEDRAAWSYRHGHVFSSRWTAAIDARRVSDIDYVNDFGDRLSVTAETHLSRIAALNYRSPQWAFTARVADYQTIDRSVPLTARPYARLPQLLLAGTSAPGSGPQYRFQGELVSFDHEVNATGERAHLNPSVRWPITPLYGFLVPEIGVRHIAYSLDQPDARGDKRPSVTAPYLSLDAGLYFDRLGERFEQTLEPRLYYLYVPHREQDHLPNFDTTVPDFTFANLFRNNRFLGGDRIGDANQLTLALTTRVLDAADGTERLRASIGRIHYFDDRRVNVPAGTIDDDNSDYAAEAVVWLPGNWHVRGATQWSAEEDHTVRASFYLQHQPAADRIFNIGYRYARGELQQLDLSFEWPLGARWITRGRALYSLRDIDRGNIDSFLGIEYRACCWALRLYAARGLVQTAAGAPELTESRSRFMFEFELAGLSRSGGAVESPLAEALFFAPPVR